MDIKALRKKKKLTQEQLATQIGVTRSAISQFESGISKPSYETLVALSKALGADLLNPQNNNTEEYTESAIVPEKAHDLLPGARILQISKGVELRYVPALPWRARATFAETWGDDSANYEQPTTIPVINVPNTKEYENCFAIEIDGDSMQPQLQSGMWVLVVPISEADWEYMPAGIYAVLYGNHFTVKRIIDNTLRTKREIVLHSDNPTGGTMAVERVKIRAVWRVKKIIDAEVV
ncbi:XRE family transcriptional regulator [Hymenobacter cavernae]|uniref:HTH cro/C1-type domain-containing protein n=1 Tax=Hymenobacter cavernae TaxID=2044852 RepID=A0ABQ1UQ17_9BACT|nr:XRE family transcriptional regulator [Hymenobacter cavernae]GGF22517.1 hypothetical protein GCM10011383_37670 [Hymenobacter cavernae]